MTGSLLRDLVPRVADALRDQYAVEAEIGRGGMAAVFRAHDRRFGRLVAIKVLLPELARALASRRFAREIQVLARLSHPNLVPVLDSGTLAYVPGLELPYYVMPFVKGETLRQRLERETQLPIQEAVALTSQLCNALGYIHELGIIHRDIKPGNVLLQNRQPILADFGIAKALSDSVITREASFSSTGLVIGTPAYMSPEQAGGGTRLDQRSDIYSLGCVLYEMLSGQPPFTGLTPQAISARHLHEPPPPIRVVRPTVTPALEQVLDRALAKTPADRYATAAEFAVALNGLSSDPLASPVPLEIPVPMAPPAPALGRYLWVATGLLLAILLGGAGAWWWSSEPLNPEKVVVLPFQHLGAAAPGLIQGADCATLIYDAIGNFRDLARVDQLTVQNALAQRGQPKTLDQGVSLARALGAGRLIWGEVYEVGDSVRVRAVLYRVTRWGSAPVTEHPLGLPGRADLSASGTELGTLVARRFAELARALIVPPAAFAALPPSAYYSTSYGALKAKNSADSAFATWDLPRAKELYRQALRLDPHYPDANLALAQLSQWTGEPAEAWRPLLATAAGQAERLDSTARLMLRALGFVADTQYYDACTVYRQMVARDSSSFLGWFGLGDCQSRDHAVVPDAKSPSGYGFRGSFRAAASAYRRALEVVPLAHRAARELIMPRLFRVYPTAIWLRAGATEGQPGRGFSAWIGYHKDTLSFIPFPTDSFTGPSPPSPPPSMQRALEADQRALHAIVEQWVTLFPTSGPAWEAKARVLERIGALRGDSATSAVGAISRARRLTTDSAALLEITIDQVRLLLKTEQFAEAARLANQALDGWQDLSPQRALRLAPLAGLTGRTVRLVELLRQGATEWEFQSPDGTPVHPPPELAADALTYYAHAVMGSPADTLKRWETRVLREIDAWAPVQRRIGAILALAEDPAYYGYSNAGLTPIHRLPGHNPALELQLEHSRGASATLRNAVHRTVLAIDSLGAGNITPESVYPLAYLLIQSGDSASAAELLDRMIESIGLQDYLTTLPQMPAFLTRGLSLRARMLRDGRDSARAADLTRKALSLRQRADPEFDWGTSGLRGLAKPGER